MFATPLHLSIRTRLFLAFAAMGLVTACLGTYGVLAINAAGRIVVDTYDRPFMAINYARAASLAFTRMHAAVLEAAVADASSAPPTGASALDDLRKELLDDLVVTEERAMSAREIAVVHEIRDLAAQWDRRRADRPPPDAARDPELARLYEAAIARFDLLTEIVAQDSFRERQQAVLAIGTARWAGILATIAAFSLAVVLTVLLARRILRPLGAAVVAADLIAKGDFAAEIPAGAADETGILLRSMAVMQTSIRTMMEREAALRRSAQFRLIDALESSREGVVLVDADGCIVIANGQAARFFPSAAPRLAEGVPLGEAVQAIVEIGADDAETGGAATGADRRPALMAGGEIALADGRWLRVTRAPTRDGGAILFWSDITDLKEREQVLERARREAEAASAAKSAFLASVSHELRTPLNAIIGFAEVLAGQMLGPLGNSSYVEHAAHIRDGGRRLLEVIGAVLDLARCEAGTLSLRGDFLELDEVVGPSAKRAAVACECAGLELCLGPPVEPAPVLWGETPRLRQVLDAILSNAIKFSPAGGRVYLDVAVAEGGRWVAIRVADEGIGMRAEDISVALAPFGQVDADLTRQYGGLGLGLPLANALVRLHGGRLEIDSAPGRGTTVTVHLPEASRRLAAEIPGAASVDAAR
jgi:signal transduction histidine kinase/HAMP domain-containing protein